MSENVHFKILEMAQLQMLGLNNKEIADKLEVCPKTVSRWKASPMFIEEYEALKAGLYEKLRVRVLQEVLGVLDDFAINRNKGYHYQTQLNAALCFLKTVKIDQLILSPTKSVVQTAGEGACNNP
jgi:hypothetical protein